MALVNWSDEYSVGVSMLDQQHQHLISMLNELNDAMLQGKGRDVVQGLLGRLLQYTRVHFSTEESLMSRWGYPELKAHQAEHERLTRKAMEFKAKFDGGYTMITVQLLSFLKEWLVSHILGMDKQYSPCAVK